MLIFVQIAGIGAGAILLYLLTVALVPGFRVSTEAPDLPSESHPPLPATRVPWKRSVRFEVGPTTLSGWLYLPPRHDAPVPCVVMAHGLGGTKDMQLEEYALRFREMGAAVLVFDYRYFGESAGQPRQLIHVGSQLRDWEAAIRYARERDEIDENRIGLWGTSMSGGHVVTLAARDPGIRCVVAQSPGLDGRAFAERTFRRQGWRMALRMIAHGQRDLVRSWLRLSPHRVPIVGRPGDIALITAPGALEGIQRIAPPGFVNAACARAIIRADKYRPVQEAQRVSCPVLVQVCDRDEVVPRSPIEDAIDRFAGPVVVKHYDIDHFDIYTGAALERAVGDQMHFLVAFL